MSKNEKTVHVVLFFLIVICAIGIAINEGSDKIDGQPVGRYDKSQHIDELTRD